MTKRKNTARRRFIKGSIATIVGGATAKVFPELMVSGNNSHEIYMPVMKSDGETSISYDLLNKSQLTRKSQLLTTNKKTSDWLKWLGVQGYSNLDLDNSLGSSWSAKLGSQAIKGYALQFQFKNTIGESATLWISESEDSIQSAGVTIQETPLNRSTKSTNSSTRVYEDSNDISTFAVVTKNDEKVEILHSSGNITSVSTMEHNNERISCSTCRTICELFIGAAACSLASWFACSVLINCAATAGVTCIVCGVVYGVQCAIGMWAGCGNICTLVTGKVCWP